MTVRVAVIGTGLIGGSTVSLSPARVTRSSATTVTPNASSGPRPWAQSLRSRARSRTRRAGASVAVIAVPVGQIVGAAIVALDAGAAVVTDVGR